MAKLIRWDKTQGNAKQQRGIYRCGVLLILTLLLYPTTVGANGGVHHSWLPEQGGGGIRDDALRELLRSLLVTSNGTSNAMNATLLFQECFGGGMLDELPSMLTGAGVNWCGASASSATQASWGQTSNRERGVSPYDTTAEDLWTTEFLAGLMSGGSFVQAAAQYAMVNDPYAKDGSESPRCYGHGADYTLNTSGAQSRHAIIWAGVPDGDRHFNDVKNVRDTLVNAWGTPNGSTTTITVLFGNGSQNAAGQNLPESWNAQPATVMNLQAAVARLRDGDPSNGEMNPNEQFVFYCTDHGGRSTVFGDIQVFPGEKKTQSLVLDPYEQAALYFDADGLDPSVTINVEVGASGLVNSVPVSVNSEQIGEISAGLSEGSYSFEFNVSRYVGSSGDEPLLDLDNIIEIDNSSNSCSFEVNEMSFYFSVNTLGTPIPEPSVLAMTIVGTFIMTIRSRKRRKV